MSHRVITVDQIEPMPTPVEEGLRWHPVRHELGITAFGTNAYTAREAGDLVVEDHDEDADEELYVVLRGAARFEVDGAAFDAPQGTLVLVTPPSRRVARATEPDTVVLAVGATPGKAFEESDWERRWLERAGR